MRLSPYHVYIVVSTAVWVREREGERGMLETILKCLFWVRLGSLNKRTEKNTSFLLD